MIKEYLLATGFNFPDYTQQLIVDQIVAANPHTLSNIVNTIIEIEGKSPQNTLYRSATPEQVLRLIQSQSQMLVRFSKQHHELDNQLVHIKEELKLKSTKLETKIDGLSKSWPNFVDSVSALKTRFERSLEFDYEDKDTLSLQKLNYYIKSEKKVLEHIADTLEQQSANKNQINSNNQQIKGQVKTGDLHRIRRKQVYEQLLQTIRIKMLEDQLSYLQQNVVSPSDVLIYNPKIVKQREPVHNIENELKELSQLVEIHQESGECRQGGLNKGQQILDAVVRQFNRHKKVADLLVEEAHRIQKSLSQFGNIVSQEKENVLCALTGKLESDENRPLFLGLGKIQRTLGVQNDDSQAWMDTTAIKTKPVGQNYRQLKEMGETIDKLRQRIRKLQKKHK